MTMSELVKDRIQRFRRPMWNETAYAKMYFFGKYRGPLIELYDRMVQEAIGEPCPQLVPVIADQTDDYFPYDGPLDKEDK